MKKNWKKLKKIEKKLKKIKKIEKKLKNFFYIVYSFTLTCILGSSCNKNNEKDQHSLHVVDVWTLQSWARPLK